MDIHYLSYVGWAGFVLLVSPLAGAVEVGRLSRQSRRPVSVRAVVMAALVLGAIVIAVPIETSLGLTRAQRVDIGIGAALAAAVGAVADSVRSAMLNAHIDPSLALASEPALILAVGPDLLFSPTVNAHSARLDRRRVRRGVGDDDEPARASRDCARRVGRLASLALIVCVIALSQSLLTAVGLNSHEISHVAVFLPVGWLIGILGEVIGRRLGHGILALVFDVVVITAIGLGGSDPTERTLSLLGMTAGAGCACLIETGVYAARAAPRGQSLAGLRPVTSVST